MRQQVMMESAAQRGSFMAKRKFTSEFKAKVALGVLRLGENTAEEANFNFV